MKEYKLTVDGIIEKNKYYIDKLIKNDIDEDDNYLMLVWLKQINNFLRDYDDRKEKIISDLSLLP